jgi:hypothetical protein
MKFSVIGQNVTNPAWNGNGTTLNWHDSVAMPQTPNGSMVLAYWNLATLNNDGTLSLTSSGPPVFLDVPAAPLMPSTLVQNFKSNSLTLTNLSVNKATPIMVAGFGPGIPGVKPQKLTVGGATLQLSTLQTAQGNAPPNYAQLVFTNNTNNLGIIAVIGGPNDSTGNNVYLFALNYMGPPNPAGYTQATASNTLTYQFYWSTTVFVANMSPSNSSSIAISLISI